MNSIKIEFALWKGYYTVVRTEPASAGLLAHFLTDDVGGSTASFMQWIEKPADYCGASNATQYVKENGIVTLTPEWVADDEENDEAGNVFRMPAPLLAELLRQWEKALKARPPHISVVIENDQVRVSGL
jgi:hypothetical protein